MFRLSKSLTSAAYLLVIWLTWRGLHGRLDMQFSVGCLFLSGVWLALTWFELNRLLRTYFDAISRLQVWLPTSFGAISAALACLTGTAEVRALAGCSLVLWIGVLVRYLHNRRLWEKVGHGPLPEGTWVNAPAGAVIPGDVILTSGRIAARLEEAVGHGEIAIRGDDGQIYLFSSYMDRGCTIDPMEPVLASQSHDGTYIVMRAKQPWSEQDNQLAWLNALAMQRANIAFRDKRRATYKRWIDKLPLPASWRGFLYKKADGVSGYDWLGLATGRRTCDHWTCIAACQELIWRMGRELDWLGSGLLSFGTGFLDPVMPDRFIAEPSYRLLVEADRLAFLHDTVTVSGTVIASEPTP